MKHKTALPFRFLGPNVFERSAFQNAHQYKAAFTCPKTQ